MKRVRADRHADRGAAIVEMAIIFPLLVLLIFGIWQVARTYNVQNTLDHASRQAGRFGAVDSSDLSAVLAVAQTDVEAAAIDWSDVIYCIGTEEGGSNTGILTNGGLTAPCVSLANGADSNDPTTGERVHVLLRIDDYPMNFLFWTVNVDLVGSAVARQEPS